MASRLKFRDGGLVGSEMRTYVISRLIQAFITIVVAFAFSFFLFRVIPGDATLAITGDPRLPAATKKLLSAQFGLDQPIYTQFYMYFLNVFQGNFGVSYQFKVPVSELLGGRLWNTMILLVPATVISILLGIAMGMLAGWFRGKRIDTALTSAAILFWSTPSFWGGMIMIYLFAVNLRIFPVGGMMGYNVFNSDWWSNAADILYHALLPMITYSIMYSGEYALVLRNALSGVLSEDYMLLARAKGCTGSQLLRRHALKNASLPVVTLIGLGIGHLVLGSVTIETVFNWPGVGRLFFDAIFYHDYPVLQGVFLLFTVGMILMIVVVDILYTYLDPRVRLR